MSLRLPGTAALLAAVLSACILATSARGSAAAISVTDPLGDAAGGPDIVAFTVEESAGELALTIRVAPGRLPTPVLFGVNFDLDRNPATGRKGEDAIVTWVSGDAGQTGTLALSRWNGAEFADAQAPGARASFSSDTFSLFLPLGLLGSASVSVRAGTLALEPFGRDDAPDTPGYVTFDVGQPIPPPPPPVKLTASTPIGTPRSPISGKRFTVAIQVRRSDIGLLAGGEGTECRAWIRGRGPVLAAPRFRAGSASCRMRVPAGARGKRLLGSIGVTDPETELSVTRTFAFLIR